MSDSLRSHGLQPARLFYPWASPSKNNEVGLPCLPPGDLPNSGIEHRSPTFQVDSLPSENLLLVKHNFYLCSTFLFSFFILRYVFLSNTRINIVYETVSTQAASYMPSTRAKQPWGRVPGGDGAL